MASMLGRAIAARKAYFAVIARSDHKILWMNRFRSRTGGPRLQSFVYADGMDLGTRLFTLLKGRRVGDRRRSATFTTRSAASAPGTALRRWVMYAGAPEASLVPPEWHAWLHYTTDAAAGGA